MKIRNFFFIACAFILCSIATGSRVEATTSTKSGGTTLNSVTRLDLQRGKVSGEKVDYELYLSSLWVGYLRADREKMSAASTATEKITFYYIPQDEKLKPAYLMNFYVFSKSNWKEQDGLHIILETEDNVFASEYAAKNQFENKTDKALFDRFLSDAADIDLFASSIKLPLTQKIVYKNTMTVNGQKVPQALVHKDGSSVYVPLRAACQAMGYQVGWLPKEKAVTILKGDFYHLLLTTGQSPNKGYKTIIINGQAYLPTMFFIQVLNANIEVDENYNVFINTSSS